MCSFEVVFLWLAEREFLAKIDFLPNFGNNSLFANRMKKPSQESILLLSANGVAEQASGDLVWTNRRAGFGSCDQQLLLIKAETLRKSLAWCQPD